MVVASAACATHRSSELSTMITVLPTCWSPVRGRVLGGCRTCTQDIAQVALGKRRILEVVATCTAMLAAPSLQVAIALRFVGQLDTQQQRVCFWSDALQHQAAGTTSMGDPLIMSTHYWEGYEDALSDVPSTMACCWCVQLAAAAFAAMSDTLRRTPPDEDTLEQTSNRCWATPLMKVVRHAQTTFRVFHLMLLFGSVGLASDLDSLILP